MKNRLIALIALLTLLGCSASLRAQSATASQNKVGVMNMQAAIANTAEGKKIIADLQLKYAPRQQELQRLQQEIQAIQDQLTKQAATLSDDEQARLNRDAQEKQKLLKRSAEDAQNDFNRDRDEAVGKMQQKMAKVINDFAHESGYVLVLDDVQIPVYYASKDIELTAEIIKRYDAAYPVEGAGASAKPAAHPATAPAAKPKP
jgi:outer membrane protein